MKKKIIFYMLVCIMLGSMTGCGKTVEEADHSATQQIEKQETNDSAAKEAEDSSTHSAGKDGMGQEGTESAPENDQTFTLLTDADPSEEYIKYKIEDYGIIKEKRQEYPEYETERIAYYYEMENFFFNDTFPNADVINQTLQEIYDEYEKGYQAGVEEHLYGMYEADAEEFPTDYDMWNLLSLTYIGDDYVSLQYNNVSYMGGAHPYSCFVGITIDCKTGEKVSAPQVLGENNGTVLAKVSKAMGFDTISTWDDLDFYLTDSYVVFFYRYPGFWEDVVFSRP